MRASRVLLAEDHPSLAAAIGEYVAEAFQLVGTVRDGGASGFVLKVHAPTELVQAIRTVLSGGTYISTAIAV